MTVLLDAVTVTDGPCLDQQPVADLQVPPTFAIAQCGTTAFDQSQVSNEAGAVSFVTEIGPDDVVEDVRLEGVDGARQAGKLPGPSGRKSSGVDHEAGDVIQMRMGDEESIDESAGDVGSIRLGRGVW